MDVIILDVFFSKSWIFCPRGRVLCRIYSLKSKVATIQKEKFVKNSWCYNKYEYTYVLGVAVAKRNVSRSWRCTNNKKKKQNIFSLFNYINWDFGPSCVNSPLYVHGWARLSLKRGFRPSPLKAIIKISIFMVKIFSVSSYVRVSKLC